MLSKRKDPLPVEAVRDLLGYVRILYEVRRRRGAPSEGLRPLEAAGVLLRQALELAGQYPPETIAHYAAWRKALDACERLRRVVGMTEGPDFVEAAVERVLGGGPTMRVKTPGR